MGDALPGPTRRTVPEFNYGPGMQRRSRNHGKVVGDAEFWGNSEGTSGAPESRGARTPCPLTTRKATLILRSQAEGLQARREGSARAKIITPPWSPEVWEVHGQARGADPGTLRKQPPSPSPGVNSGKPHCMREKTRHLRAARELQATPTWNGRGEWFLPEGTVAAPPSGGACCPCSPMRTPEKQQARARQCPQTLPAVRSPQGLEPGTGLHEQAGGHGEDESCGRGGQLTAERGQGAP